MNYGFFIAGQFAAKVVAVLEMHFGSVQVIVEEVY